MNYAIKNKRNFNFDLIQQLLIYIRGKKKIKKSRVMKVIEMSFALLSKKNKLGISVLTDFVADNIVGNMIHIVLQINNCIEKNY